MTLQGKNILVIGGSSGIGFGVARAALGEGAAVDPRLKQCGAGGRGG